MQKFKEIQLSKGIFYFIKFCRFKEDEYNKKLEKLEIEERQRTQLMYKETLAKQIEIKNSHNFGTMTQSEKKLNKPELSGYKQSKREVSCLIPGINHIDSIGSKPTYRTGLVISPAKESIKIDYSLTNNKKLYMQDDGRSRSLRRTLSRDKIRSENNENPIRNKSMQRNADVTQGFSKPSSRNHRRGLTNSIIKEPQLHNPITNPIESNNPYAKYARNKVLSNSLSMINLS